MRRFSLLPYFYNPNINTSAEYFLRAEQFGKLGVEPIIEKYEHNEFLQVARGFESEPEGGARCRACIALRKSLPPRAHSFISLL